MELELLGRKVPDAVRSRNAVGKLGGRLVAVRFCEKNGFRLVTPEKKDRLVPRYWDGPERQIETSAVLADDRWFTERKGRTT